MVQEDLILKLEIVPERAPEADSVAEAIAAFVDVLRAAAAVAEPETGLSVELVGVEPGSQMFKLALRKLHDAAERIGEGGDEFPLFKKAAITLGGLIGSTVLVVTITNAMTPDSRIPPDQMAVFEEINRNMAESVDLQRQSARFWGVMQDEPAFSGVRVLNGHDRSQIYSVPRSEFAERSGLWDGDGGEFVAATERRTATWDVILVKPVLLPSERRWTFAREGLEFSALMTDKAVLQAIHDRTLPLQLAEGVPMKIEVQYRERYDGKAWLPIPGSHRVRRVLSPLPPTRSGPLFAPNKP
ncbi:hypothetical protein [Hephaestia mangrovi]|uniref:hypothetical protein n=1 Tax=Hephaestia mangrovi TaxID=2873268 RepID=UPI001CA6B1AC|nr:hypothetical protein [Hephaestia mangrovi]MBY8828656.1 hypothetical protein [Hephaestia mangrovi]